jgi:hypothetical protein
VTRVRGACMAASIALSAQMVLASPAWAAAIEDPHGVPVTFTCKDPAMEIFLARGDVPAGTVPDPFERVGLAPITLHLAPGTYSIETASQTTSTGHERFAVEEGSPLTVEVHPGDASVKAIGTVLAGIGIVSIVLGIVAVVSISPNDQHYDRFAVGLPLLIGGAGAIGVGVSMVFIGSTDIRAPHLPPASAPRAAAQGMSVNLSWRF